MDENFERLKEDLKIIQYNELLINSKIGTEKIIEYFNKKSEDLDENTVCYLYYKYLNDYKIYEDFKITLTKEEELYAEKKRNIFDDMGFYRTIIKDAKIIFKEQLELLNKLEKEKQQESLER